MDHRAGPVQAIVPNREWDDNGTCRSKHHIVGRVQFGGKPDGQPADHAEEIEEVEAF